ncbi:Benzil reductase ((S)-benzoin forming) [Planctomycetes bacterium Pan216]|uniref:Benzil reductase ((S)-benzoin forming) n=1 Tax=Kolteria novifilia TaxID=2527975 RepID=A0A518BCU1_9BACT|nr:Benzil reductase ((S)-benzoin forming) [Planctomycetes bacterium Pan216]
MPEARNTTFITGVSSGIGHALAATILDADGDVIGVSRREPKDLARRDSFRFRSLDLSESDRIVPTLIDLLRDTGAIDLAILNAGILGTFGDLAEADLDEMRHVMDVNLWANKLVLDALFAESRTVRQVVTMSSGAAVNGNRGWRGYSLSKAALNMLTKLYAAERPGTHFCAIAPGLVDTAMQDQLCGIPPSETYPSLEVLRSKRETSDMPTSEELAPRLLEVIARVPEHLPSGSFADIRQLPFEV